MLINVDIKRSEEHLSILQNELKEVEIILEMLMTICQMLENPTIVLKQINFFMTEKTYIHKRICILENSVEKFLTLKRSTGNTLEDTLEMLKFYEGLG